MNTKSFTLIEILVAIVIVGILSTFIIVSLNNVVDSANDAKRKKDLDSISKMLMTYRILNGFYPAGDDNIETALSDLIPDYTTSFPKDPSGLSYNYSSDGTTYTLTSQTLSYNSESGFAEGGGSEPWLTGYSYRKEITLSNSGSELTDYQLKFTINRTAGTDSGFTTYLGTKCLDNYNDIRFTDSSHQVLSYWIESSNSSIATVWVKADTLVGSGNTTLYLYYGNNSASAVSNGDTTFQFFDDFLGSTLNTEIWDYVATPVVGSGIVTLTGTNNEEIISKTTYGTNTAIRSRAYFDGSGTGGQTSIGYNNDIQDTYCIEIFNYGTDTNAYGYNKDNTGGSGGSLSLGISTDTYHTWDIVRNGTINTMFRRDVGSWQTLTTKIYTDSLPINCYNRYAADISYIDWILVRKYTATEPTVPAWGGEESF